ncbi:MAG TPA: thiamine-phosphate kinase [Nitrospira sp.]|nr:thiamine-phosphate kinase [Nitrospira sp.]
MASRPWRKAISTINEFDLIRALQRRYRINGPGVLRGIGDDAAVIASEPRRRLLFTTDLLAEGIHFDLATASFVDLGFRAATANLSDIAAMGGTPEYILVSLAMPQSASKVQVEQMYRGLMTACRPHGVRLIGGDTSASATGWFLNITLVGSAPARDVLLRSGSKPGDTLYVTGTLGDSRAGLQLLQHSPRRSRPSISFRHRRFLVTRHLRPTARIREGCWLARGRWATSAIDISDGLSGDLRHLCDASQVGVDLDLSMLPISPACRAYAHGLNQDPAMVALAGGEDYELLFTVPSRRSARFEQATRAQRIHVTRVGSMLPRGRGLHMIMPSGRRQPLPVVSYEHFRSQR